MDGMMEEDGTSRYALREVVGVFPNANALEAAVEQLEISGVDRAGISVLGTGAGRSGRVDDLYRSAQVMADDPAAPQAAFVAHASLLEGEAVAVAIPLQIGGFAGAWAVAAAGGALIAAIGAAIVGGAVGAGLGALLFRTIAHQHSMKIESQLAQGGLVVWVKTPDDASEARVLGVLRSCGGLSVHTHTIEREWGIANSPLHGVQPDPFLISDKV
jgi:hypothetical protein